MTNTSTPTAFRPSASARTSATSPSRTLQRRSLRPSRTRRRLSGLDLPERRFARFVPLLRLPSHCQPLTSFGLTRRRTVSPTPSSASTATSSTLAASSPLPSLSRPRRPPTPLSRTTTSTARRPPTPASTSNVTPPVLRRPFASDRPLPRRRRTRALRRRMSRRRGITSRGDRSASRGRARGRGRTAPRPLSTTIKLRVRSFLPFFSSLPSWAHSLLSSFFCRQPHRRRY